MCIQKAVFFLNYIQLSKRAVLFDDFGSNVGGSDGTDLPFFFQLEKSIHRFFQRIEGKVRSLPVCIVNIDIVCLQTSEAVFQIFTNCSGGKITVNIASRRPEQCRTIRFPDQLLPRWCEWRVHHHFLPTRCLRQLPRYPFRYMEFLKLLFRLYVLFA